jgi:hypothetical protein
MKRFLSLLIVLCLMLSFFGISSVRGDGGIIVRVETDKVLYSLGDTVYITFTVSNESDIPQKLIFNTSQIYDFVIFNISKQELGYYRWSAGRMFAQVITEINLEPNEVKVFTEKWDQKGNNGVQVSVGTYRLNFWLVSNPSDKIGEPANIDKFGDSRYLATKTFSIVTGTTIVSPFSDVKDPEMINFVYLLYGKGIIQGYPDGTFKPQNNLTRAEAVALILRTMNITPQRYVQPTFSDVPRVYWAFNLIEEAYKRSIIKGVSQDKFSPGTYISRGEFTVMVVRALGFDVAEISNPFQDLDESYFGYKEILAAYSLGIVKGESKNGKIYFNPLTAITRGEAAIILGRAIQTKTD